MYVSTAHRVRFPGDWWRVVGLLNSGLRLAGMRWRVYVLGDAHDRSFLTLCVPVPA